MSELCIVYKELEEAVAYSENVREAVDSYVAGIGNWIAKPVGSLEGADSGGYAATAATLAENKMAALINKKTFFTGFENSVKDVISMAKEADTKVAAQIERLTEGYIGDRSWLQEAGDWIYNTFCVDMVNHFSLLRDFANCVKWFEDKVENGLNVVYNWFRYGDGKYIWRIGTAIVGAGVAVAGAAAAICAIPFSGGLSIPLVIGCIGALATSIGAIITVVNSYYEMKSNAKALTLSGNIFDGDDGNPGAARYYGNISKVSEYWEKTDMGDKETNEAYQKKGEAIDRTKVAADTVAFFCNIASLGNVKDYRITTKNDNINFNYNQDHWYKGYNFTFDNIKRNIMHDMGFKISSGELKDGAFKLRFFSKDKQQKYTLIIGKKIWAAPEWLVNTFNVFKTTDNTMKFAENVGGLYDFSTDSDKDIAEFSKTIQNVTGILKLSKPLAIFDNYGTKTGKTIINVVEAIEEAMTRDKEFTGAGRRR